MKIIKAFSIFFVVLLSQQTTIVAQTNIELDNLFTALESGFKNNIVKKGTEPNAMGLTISKLEINIGKENYDRSFKKWRGERAEICALGFFKNTGTSERQTLGILDAF